MTYDPHYFTGDIIASINAGICTEEELLGRFDNPDNSILQRLVFGKVNELVGAGLLRRNRRGVLSCTMAGRRYIAERGYLS